MTNFTETDLLGMEKRSYAEIDFSEKKPVVSEAVRLSKREKGWVWGISIFILFAVLSLDTLSNKLENEQTKSYYYTIAQDMKIFTHYGCGNSFVSYGDYLIIENDPPMNKNTDIFLYSTFNPTPYPTHLSMIEDVFPKD